MFTIPIIMMLALFAGYSEGDPALVGKKIDAWKAAHPYQMDVAPANPARVTGGSTSENPE